jgi:hypothetical protein
MKDLALLKHFKQIIIYYSKPQSLLHTDGRRNAIESFAAVLHYIVSGYSRIGYLRKDTGTFTNLDIDSGLQTDVEYG